ncbi:MAG: hypothetical protein J5592_00675 [Clostridia bacterium]|nr:hypothetical protein [Clostridia bacterium]
MITERDRLRVNTRPMIILCIASAAAAALLSCVINPLYIVFTSDIVYLQTILPTLFGILSDLFDNMISAVLIAVAAAAAYLFRSAGDGQSKKRTAGIRYLILPCGIIFLKSLLNFLATLVLQGFVTFETADLVFTLVNCATEWLILAVAFIVSSALTRARLERTSRLARAYATQGRDYPGERAEVYPFRGFFSVKNPVLSGILWASLTLLLPLVISRLIYDISLGAPADIDEAAAIPIGYLSDLFWSFLVYTAGFFTASSIMSLQNADASEGKDQEPEAPDSMEKPV